MFRLKYESRNLIVLANYLGITPEELYSHIYSGGDWRDFEKGKEVQNG